MEELCPMGSVPGAAEWEGLMDMQVPYLRHPLTWLNQPHALVASSLCGVQRVSLPGTQESVTAFTKFGFGCGWTKPSEARG